MWLTLRSRGSSWTAARRIGFWILKINDYLSDLRQHKDAETQPVQDGCLENAGKKDGWLLKDWELDMGTCPQSSSISSGSAWWSELHYCFIIIEIHKLYIYLSILWSLGWIELNDSFRKVWTHCVTLPSLQSYITFNDCTQRWGGKRWQLESPSTCSTLLNESVEQVQQARIPLCVAILWSIKVNGKNATIWWQQHFF